jgi:heat shock protein HtpX
MRILLFLATNLAILLVLGVAMQLLGVDRALAEQGVSVLPLFVLCAVLGVGGSFVSLLVSKWMALRTTGAQVIEQPRNDTEAWLLQTVTQHARAAGIGMPTLAVFPSDSPNAFATGANKDKALVAVSSGLLTRMRRNEVEAVLGHEIGHVANGDMVTLALIQGVLNTFVFFLARVIGQIVDQVVFRRGDSEHRGPGMGYFMVVMLAQLVLGMLASLIVFWFSRRREFRADREGARLAGRESMIGALERLKAASDAAQPLPDSLRAFGISGGGGFARLLMTHPPLDERIAALRLGA